MAKEVKCAAVQGGIRHDNHTAPASLTLRSIIPKINYLLIKNKSLTSSANVSFDGVNSFPINPGGSLSMEVSGLIAYYTSGSVDLAVLFGSEE